jgi:hypothetical protein
VKEEEKERKIKIVIKNFLIEKGIKKLRLL